MLNRLFLLAVLAISTTPDFACSGNQGSESKKAESKKEELDPQALMKMMDGFRTKLPPPQGLGEENGRGRDDEKGEPYLYSHLRGVALRMGVKSKINCMILLTYLKDSKVKVRLIAAFALEDVLKANDFSVAGPEAKLDSDQHRSMVQAFIAGIEKLAK